MGVSRGIHQPFMPKIDSCVSKICLSRTAIVGYRTPGMFTDADFADYNQQSDRDAKAACTLLRLGLLLAGEPHPCAQSCSERMLEQAFTRGAERFLDLQHQLEASGQHQGIRIAADGRIERVLRPEAGSIDAGARPAGGTDPGFHGRRTADAPETLRAASCAQQASWSMRHRLIAG